MLLETTGLDIARYIVIVFQVVVCILLILVVMMQRPKQEGLGAAFGGDTMDSLAGAGATDFLQRGTALLGTILFVLTFLLSILVIAGAKPANKSLLNPSEKPPEIVANSETQAVGMEELGTLDPDADDPDADELDTTEADTLTPDAEVEVSVDSDLSPEPIAPATEEAIPATTTPEETLTDKQADALEELDNIDPSTLVPEATGTENP